jgi:adenylate cyclase
MGVVPEAANGDNAVATGAPVRVGAWTVDGRANTLQRDGQKAVRLEPKAVEVLLHLAGHPGEVISREELMAAVWPGVVVGDDALTQAIIKLRKALGDDARQPRYIETISKRGYRLVAAAGQPAPATPTAAMPQPPARRRRTWLAALALTLLAILVAGIYWADRVRDSHPAPPIVAVLPLANQSGDATRDYFSDGLTQDLINALSLFSGLRVIAHQTAQTYKTRPVSAQDLRRELGVRYVVRGSVRESDGKLRVTVELSDADSAVVLWSDRIEGDDKQMFAFQDRIVRNVVGALTVKVTRHEEELAFAKPPRSLQSYDLVLRARALVAKSDRVANRQARELLARALELSPEYAEAYLVFAGAEAQRSIDFGWTEDPSQSAERAEQYAQRALTLGDVGAQARSHGQLGVLYSAARRYELALAEVDMAVALNPSDARALDTRGFVLVWLGRLEEALASLEMGARFDPLGRGAGGVFSHALAYYSLHRYAESVALADAGLARFPQTSFLHAIRAAALAQTGQSEAARAEAEQTLRLEPFFHAKDFGDRFADPMLMAHLQEGLRKAGL